MTAINLPNYFYIVPDDRVILIKCSLDHIKVTDEGGRLGLYYSHPIIKTTLNVTDINAFDSYLSELPINSFLPTWSLLNNKQYQVAGKFKIAEITRSNVLGTALKVELLSPDVSSLTKYMQHIQND